MKLLGNKGEDFAVKHLKKKGYRIIRRNYKTPVGEIDIIAEDGGTLVFVEVKTRTDTTFGLPKEAVDHRKQVRIRNAALNYMSGLKRERPGRFDIISVYVKDKARVIDHLEDAFEMVGNCS
jgi:putative endonuclease